MRVRNSVFGVAIAMRVKGGDVVSSVETRSWRRVGRSRIDEEHRVRIPDFIFERLKLSVGGHVRWESEFVTTCTGFVFEGYVLVKEVAGKRQAPDFL